MRKMFGRTRDGQDASIYSIENTKGMKVVLTDFGATVVNLMAKDKDGNLVDVALGYDNVRPYETEKAYFGATVGRYANRISDAKIIIDGEEYVLEANDNENNLHSGSNGTSEKMWKVKESGSNYIVFEIESKDLEQGFPGNATMEVRYEVTEDNELSIEYKAVSDKTTTFNMTNHTYFNLSGHDSGDVYNQTLQIKASKYTPLLSSKAIPTGKLEEVEGTPFDFRTAKEIGKDINEENEQLKFGTGYDHNFAIDKETDGVEKVATAYSPVTGISMDVLTDCIGIQLYTANFIEGQVGKNNTAYHKRNAYCLETQYYPNSINEENFLSPITKAGEEYKSKTVYAFSVK